MKRSIFREVPTRIWVSLTILVLLTIPAISQLNQSGGPGSSVTVTSISAGSNIIGKVGVDQTTPGTTNGVSLAQLGANTVNTGTGAAGTGTLRVAVATDSSFSIANTAFGISAGSAIMGFVRPLPSGCGSLVTIFNNTTAQVATGAGTTVTTTTTCTTFVFVNNITNSAVTLRLADRQGTPVIWVGGNADFSIPANSNFGIPVEGVTFTSGITAIAGTATALNLQISGLQ